MFIRLLISLQKERGRECYELILEAKEEPVWKSLGNPSLPNEAFLAVKQDCFIALAKKN